jgi:hypothetical protein
MVDAMRKGCTWFEVLVVAMVIFVVAVLLIPAFLTASRASRMKGSAGHRPPEVVQTFEIEEERSADPDVIARAPSFFDGDIVYLVLDGRKAQIVWMNTSPVGTYRVRYMDDVGRLLEMDLYPYEIVKERPRLDEQEKEIREEADEEEVDNQEV